MEKNFGIELGLPLAGMSKLQKADNPLIQTNDHLGFYWSWTADFFSEFIRPSKTGKPSYGIKIKLAWNFFINGNTSALSSGEIIGLHYIALPILFKLCLSSKDVYLHSYYTPTTYDVTGNSNNSTITETPGSYHGGGWAKKQLFFYAGPQVSYLINWWYPPNDQPNSLDGFKAAEQKMNKTDLAVVAGFEFCVNRTYFDLSYQKGLQPIYPQSHVYINAPIVRLGFIF